MAAPAMAAATPTTSVAAASSIAAAATSSGKTAPDPGPSTKKRAVLTPDVSTPELQKIAATLPDYAPAGCNIEPQPGQVRCDALVKTNKQHQVAEDASVPLPGALGPAQIQAAYGLPAHGGAGRTVAIVDAGGYSTAESDLAVFRAQFGLPACTTANGCFRKTDQGGGTNYPPNDPSWAEETSLDLDAVSSACPDCRILLVEANTAYTTDLGAAENTAVRLGAKFVSNSYSADDYPTELSYTQWEHPGVVVTAATGDTGNAIGFPADDPAVVAVGGTTLTADSSSARGWTESAWKDGGSGCSGYEPLPDYQAGLGTDCTHKATSDISADADPETGLAIYDTLGVGGWEQVGGTSLATPLTAAMYAIAGDPAPGTNPVTYPYAHGGAHLNDVTAGSNGTCGNVLCNAGPGWDGPTGLGTPNGVGALTIGSVGTVTGTITAGSGTSTPVVGATVAFTDSAQGLTFRAITDLQGAFTLPATAGTYTETVTDFGYDEASASNVKVTVGQTTTASLTLTAIPSETLSGVVTDGSGHGWPLYAAISVAGDPGTVYTDPKTGAYSIALPKGHDYSLTITPVYAGYVPADATVSVGTSALTRNFSVGVDPATCVAPGYFSGSTGFEGWTGTTAQNGWSVTGDGSAHTWQFDSMLGNVTGGTGNFATASTFDNNFETVDSDLVSPVVNMTGDASPSLKFDDASMAEIGVASVQEVDLSIDGGTTWTKVAAPAVTGLSAETLDVPLLAAAGQPNVRVRFHFEGSGSAVWQIDDVDLGDCVAVGGGLVEGTVTDGNTGRPIDGAAVTDQADAQATAVSTATPADPALSDGFYYLFSEGAGSHTYTTSDDRYTSLTDSAVAVADSVVQADHTLQAGQLTVSQDSLSVDKALGKQGTHDITLTNTGTAPLHVTLGEQSAGSTAPASAADGAWQAIADYPEQVMDNMTGYYAGKEYSVGGQRGSYPTVAIADGFVYDPVSAAWSPIAPMPQPRVMGSAAFVDGTMYVVGGYDTDLVEQTAVYAYHPASDSWTQVASMPQGVAEESTAVLNGELYVIAGCTDVCNTQPKTVYRYSPATDTWTTVASYPTDMQWGSCAGLANEIVCAGGEYDNPNATSIYETHVNFLKSTYIYSPESNTWTQGADMPYGAFGMSSSGANGQLQVAGGVNEAGAATTQAEQYDPVHNVWTALPSAIKGVFRGGGSECGMFQIGGVTAGGVGQYGDTVAEMLPGFDQCGGDQVAWLSADHTTLDLAPGKSAHVKVTADAGQVAAPGDYAAELTFTTDTPYVNAPTTVDLHATKPASWGEVSGTVTATGSAALPGATVQICAVKDTANGQCAHPLYTVTTDAHGSYALWLPGGKDSVDVIATVSGYTAQSKEVVVSKGGSATADFALAKA